jgi:hypothetical protein
VAIPVLSHWASVRLPWPRFRKPPCDPGQRVFPNPVLTLAIPSCLSTRSETLRLTPITPRTAVVCYEARSPLRIRCSWLRVQAGPEPPSAQSPFARLGRYLRRGGVHASSVGVTPPSSLLRTHVPVPFPPTASVCKPCTAGPCRLQSAPAGNGTFPTLSLRILPWMPGPLPRRSPRCVCSFLPLGLRPSLS